MFKGGWGENHRPSRAMPLPRVSRPQELGGISYDPQSKKDQPTHQSSPLQNGDARIHPPPSQAGGLDRVHTLPFGLRPAPRLFTRLVACVAAFLRQRGLRLFCYLDDWLLAAESRDLLSRQLHFLLQTVQALGFLINWENSELSPSRRPTFLGAAIDLPASWRSRARTG